MPRLFVAIPMPGEAAPPIGRLARGLPDARWTPLGDLHLTLRFLGEVDHDTFCEIGEALAGITLPPFDLALKGIGQFPPRGPLRHLWVGVEPSDGLERLKRRVDRAAASAGVPPESRKWLPHVTVARFRYPPPEARLGDWLRNRSLFRAEPFPVSAFCLYSSRLHPDGAEHTLEASYDFVTGFMERV
ncbi:MAG: RNA 2',3'-cyclic phosphodiesterase [Geminicoccaceae bacterium]|nr:RNA 2',3'-cyclic phosphodiesterase [Geminicoccaceae bacterium]